MALRGIVEGRPISYHSQASHSQLPGWQYAMEVLRLCLVLHNRFNKEVWTTKSMSSRGGQVFWLRFCLYVFHFVSFNHLFRLKRLNDSAGRFLCSSVYLHINNNTSNTIIIRLNKYSRKVQI